MKLPAIRHRLLLSLAQSPHPATLRQLAQDVGRSPTSIHHHVARLRQAGLVERAPTGFRLRLGVVVSRRGFVGRVVPLEGDRG